MITIVKRLAVSSLSLASAFVLHSAFGAELDATSAVDAVTVYPDGASVTRVIEVDLPAEDATVVARDFPLSLDASTLRVEGEGEEAIAIAGVDVRPTPPQANPPGLDKDIEALRDERAKLDDVVDAATARRDFAKRFAAASPAGLGDKGEARPLADWRAAFVAVAEEVAAADADIGDARRKQRDLDRQLARLEAERAAKPPSKLEVRIELAAAKATRAKLRVTYEVSEAHWTPLYEARLDTGGKDGKPSLELVRRAEIAQASGEDWSNVALAVSTQRVAVGSSAPDLGALIVQYPQPARDAMAKAPAPAAALEATRSVALVAATQRQASVAVDNFQATFTIPGRVSLGANDGEKSLRLSSATLAPDLLVRAAPVLDPTAYLEASFKAPEDAPLLRGRATLYRDGAFVGAAEIGGADKEGKARFGFGPDEKVKIERTIAKRSEGSTGLLTTSKTDERSFKTIVRNGHPFRLRIAVEDRLPVSENADIVVEKLPSTTPPTATDVGGKRGVLEWAFDAAPGEAKEIDFAWRAQWPGDKTVTFVPGE